MVKRIERISKDMKCNAFISSPMCHLIETYILQRNGGVIPESLEEAQELFYPIADGLSMLEREVA
jgi:hypothetical protein